MVCFVLHDDMDDKHDDDDREHDGSIASIEPKDIDHWKKNVSSFDHKRPREFQETLKSGLGSFFYTIDEFSGSDFFCVVAIELKKLLHIVLDDRPKSDWSEFVERFLLDEIEIGQVGQYKDDEGDNDGVDIVSCVVIWSCVYHCFDNMCPCDQDGTVYQCLEDNSPKERFEMLYGCKKSLCNRKKMFHMWK